MGPRKRSKPNPKAEAESQCKVETEVYASEVPADANESIDSKDGAASGGANNGTTLVSASKYAY